ncbi:hypothetical protein AB0M47_27735 [Hamadaea sp. NPDC051192]|uniref:hypothetical protein n=1 Tax=Hamadaea sp. NPDC051192 TaxID=3154940 RepID=UPI00343789A5
MLHLIGRRLDSVPDEALFWTILTGDVLMMRAIRLHPPGGIEGLRLDEVAPPQPRPGQVLVRVHAAAITRGELDWPSDRLPAIPSYELSGVVVEDGDWVLGR